MATLKIARAKAKRALGRGFTEVNGSEVMTKCPDCRLPIYATVDPWTDGAGRKNVLINRLVIHLRANCNKEGREDS